MNSPDKSKYPTPRTDAATMFPGGGIAMVRPEFARQLERESAEWERQAKRFNLDCQEAQTRAYKVERELAALSEDYGKLLKDSTAALAEAHLTIRYERDRNLQKVQAARSSQTARDLEWVKAVHDACGRISPTEPADVKRCVDAYIRTLPSATADSMPKAFATMPRGILSDLKVGRQLKDTDYTWLATLLDELTHIRALPAEAEEKP